MAIILNKTGVMVLVLLAVLAFVALWSVNHHTGDSREHVPTTTNPLERDRNTKVGTRSSLPSKSPRSSLATTTAGEHPASIVILKPNTTGDVVSLDYALKQIAGAENQLVPYSAQLKTSQPEKIETLEDASSLISHRVPMVADGVPTSAVVHGAYFWFSGGTNLRPIWDFSQGLAVRKSDGSIFRWKASGQ